MKTKQQLNKLMLTLSNNLSMMERKFVQQSIYSDISTNDMHIIEAIGPTTSRNMSFVAKKLGVTVGTLTIAVNSLVRKSYVTRVRSEEDKRVVLISLSDKGQSAYRYYQSFYDKLQHFIEMNIDEEQCEQVVKALEGINDYMQDQL